jgi:hypothetical protein
MDLGLFTTSTAILTLEVLQTRIFNYSLDPLTIYLAMGVCMLGLGAGATLLALFAPESTDAARRWAALSAVASALAIPLSHAIFALHAPGFYQSTMAALFILTTLTIPYVFLGLTVALLLLGRSESIGQPMPST